MAWLSCPCRTFAIPSEIEEDFAIIESESEKEKGAKKRGLTDTGIYPMRVHLLLLMSDGQNSSDRFPDHSNF